MTYAFDTWPLRKIYLEAAENSLARYRSLLTRLGSEEGVLREHVFSDGQYQDVHVIAIYRDEYRKYLSSLPREIVEAY